MYSTGNGAWYGDPDRAGRVLLLDRIDERAEPECLSEAEQRERA